jgi:hypothetical protein
MAVTVGTDPILPVDVAGQLDPAGPVLRWLLWTVAEHGAGDLAGEVDAGLRALVDALGDPEIRVVFGGHFSCGKSTLINALMGREVLPTGDLPETGAPCVLRAGEVDRLRVHGAGGSPEELPFSTASIARHVRLVDEHGAYRRAVHDRSRLLIELAGDVPAPGVSWTDSPGINDTDAMTDRARTAAGDADLLVWVVNSRQPFAEIEQAFVAEHVAAHGPASVAFVVNAFLTADDASAWSWFVTERLDLMRGRIADAEITGPLSPMVIAASARAFGADAGRFGGPEVRELLRSAASGRREIALTRLSRAHHRLGALTGRVRIGLERERQEVDRAAGARRERARAGEAGREQLAQVLEPGLRYLFGRYAQQVPLGVWEIQRIVSSQELRRDSTYGDWLTAAMTTLGSRLADEIVVLVNWHAPAHGLGPMRPEAVVWLRELLRPGRITVVVPSTPPSSVEAAGAALGGMLGNLLAPGPGAERGARFGAAVGAIGSARGPALERDRTAAVVNLIAAGHAAAAALEARRAGALRLVLDPAATPLVLPDPPDQARLRALDALHQHLAGTALPAVASARDAALARVAS